MINEDNNKKAQQLAGCLYTVFEGKKRTHSEVVQKAKLLMPALGISDDDTAYAIVLNYAISIYESEVGIKTFDPNIIANDKKSNLWLYKKKDQTSHAFFDRYKAYLRREGFSYKAIDSIEQISEKVLSYCADPQAVAKDKKRGLVVGDVQSGKTANYLGLINMAFDYGYRIVVLLAGMPEMLRMQTQKRVDSGIVGAISDSIGNQIEYCGVGLSNNDHFAVPFTNIENDFKKFIQKNLNASINDFKKPVVLVVKKNKSILESVIERLQPALKQYGSNSLLVIDDEADNASISTSKPGDDPTAINRSIRAIFNSFSISSYVGFTATPFANVFINPFDDPDNMDLFPSDFIVQINAPNNYFGARKVFSGTDELARPIRLIHEDEENFLPTIHKKDDRYNGLTDSLKEAILSFLINNVVRTLRGHTTKHRSMLVNISRFNDMQQHICDAITNYIGSLKNIIEQDCNYPVERFIKNEEMKKLYKLFSEDGFYEPVRMGNPVDNIAPITWNQIQNGLYNEIKQVQTAIVNRRNKFNYNDYDDRGARVIAIGGYVLSRGLTLEGLMVSYYNRSTSAYDTLLQMCRWFGYRPKYEDLCRIYITQVNVDNFNAVLDAVDDLKSQFAEMERKDKKPIDFGLMIKESPDSLQTTLTISARNKLRYTDEIVYHMNYGGVYADTSKIPKDPSINKHNFKAFQEFFNVVPFSKSNDRYMVQNVPKSVMADFVRKLKVSYLNRKFDVEGLSEYIENSDVFLSWDVVIATGDSKRFTNMFGDGWKAPSRSFHFDSSESFIRIGGSNNRVLDPGIFNSAFHLTDEQHNELLTKKGADTNLTALDYLQYRQTPLFVIYPLDLLVDLTSKEKQTLNGYEQEHKMKKESIRDSFGNLPVMAFAFGFPTKESKVKFNYRINKIKIAELNNELDVDEDDMEGNDD